jgi:hypothetical protein
LYGGTAFCGTGAGCSFTDTNKKKCQS